MAGGGATLKVIDFRTRRTVLAAAEPVAGAPVTQEIPQAQPSLSSHLDFSRDLVRDWEADLNRLQAQVMINLIHPASRTERRGLRERIDTKAQEIRAARRATWGWPFEELERLRTLERKARYLRELLDRLEREFVPVSPHKW